MTLFDKLHIAFAIFNIISVAIEMFIHSHIIHNKQLSIFSIIISRAKTQKVKEIVVVTIISAILVVAFTVGITNGVGIR